MKKSITLFVLFLLCSSQISAQLGYWYGSEFIELYEKKGSLSFVQVRNQEKAMPLEIIKHVGTEIVSKITEDRFLVKNMNNIKIKGCYISSLHENPQRQDSVIILPEIILSTEKEDVLSYLLSKYNGILSLSDKQGDTIYKLACNLSSSEEVLKLAMAIHDIEGIKWCEPNKISGFVNENTYYSNQYYLKNSNAGVDINIEPAWKIVTGNPNIRVAVIDGGVDKNHEDFEGYVLDGYTVNNQLGQGAPLTNNSTHGTCCAGIIGAANNSIGVRGVASNVSILPVNITIGYSSSGDIYADDHEIAKAIRWAVDNGADVISCSWGGLYGSNCIRSAIYYARKSGRNGKGAVVVAASGNYYENYSSVSFPACINEVIAVGAVDKDGLICHYTQRGDSLNLVAPSCKYLISGDVYTTTITGQGNVSENYTSEFGGTSAACPQVAGVAALMLSIRPDLTESQIRTILQNTAQDLGSIGFDTTYGYGLVNAYAAVKAVSPTISGNKYINGTSTYQISNLPANATVQWSVSNNCLSIVSGQNDSILTVSKANDGISLISANIIYNGDTLTTLQKKVVVGTPMLGSYLICYSKIINSEGEEEILEDCWIEEYDKNYFEMVDYNSDAYDYLEARLYMWTSNYNARTVVWSNNHLMDNVGSISCSVFCDKSYRLEVRGHNENGYSDWETADMIILPLEDEGGDEEQVILNPNPATESTTLSFATSTSGTKVAKTATSTAKTTAVEKYEIQVWSGTELVRKYTTDQPTFQIPVYDLKSGMYFVKVHKGGKCRVAKLIVGNQGKYL